MNLVQHFTGGEEVSIRHWAANLSVRRISLFALKWIYTCRKLQEGHQLAEKSDEGTDQTVP